MLRAAACLCLVACANAVYVVNVTFTGVGVGATLPLPSLWTMNITGDTILVNTGPCPAGFYCPPGVQAPVPCPLGTLWGKTGLTVVCPRSCPIGFYCPDASAALPCPEHTTSPLGSSSKLQCVCVDGFQCTYSKEVQLHVLLQLPLKTWLGSAVVQSQFVKVVAAASGVPTENVHIQQVLPHLGNRRLLALRPGIVRTRHEAKLASPRTTLVKVTVLGAMDVRGLDSVLARHNVLRGVTIRTWPVARLLVSHKAGLSLV